MTALPSPAPRTPEAAPASRDARELPPAPSRDGGGGISLRRRVYLLMAIGLFCPLVAWMGLTRWWGERIDARVLAARVSAASAVAAHIDDDLTDDLEVLQRFSSAVAPALSEPGLESARRLLRETHAQIRHREAVFLLDGNGRVLAEETRAARTRASIRSPHQRVSPIHATSGQKIPIAMSR